MAGDDHRVAFRGQPAVHIGVGQPDLFLADIMDACDIEQGFTAAGQGQLRFADQVVARRRKRVASGLHRPGLKQGEGEHYPRKA